MSKYTQLKEIQKTGVLRKLISVGFINANLWDRLLIYEYYLSEGVEKMQAYCNTSENFNISERTVQRIVEWMESE